MSKRLFDRVAVVLYLMMFSINLSSQQLPIPSNIIHKQLDNGFSYYILPNGEPGKIGLYLFSDTGSYVEKREERGVAHFLEHMVFKGSKNFPGNKTADTLESLGLRIGRDYNGSVNDIFTEYRVFIPENNKVTLEKTLRMMNDWCFNLQMDANDLEVEKKVVIEEIKLRSSGGTPFVIGTYLEGHNGLGTAEQINSVTAKDVKDFYKKYYTTDQLALVVHGKVDEKNIIRYIDKLFGELPGTIADNRNKYLDLSKETIVSGEYKNKRADMLVLGFKTRDFPVNTVASFKKDFIYKVFCEMLSNRLSKLPDSDIKKVTANTAVPFTGNLWFNFRLEAKEGASYKTMLDNFNFVIAQARRFGFLQEEIDYYVNDFLKRYKRLATRSEDYLGDVKKHFLKGDVPLSLIDKVKYTQQISNEISPEDFSDLLNHFTEYNKTILFDNTAKAFEDGFDESYILASLRHIEKNAKVMPYKFSEPSSQFAIGSTNDLPEVEIEDKEAGKIKKKVKLGDYLYVLKYDNGIKVVVNNAPKSDTQIKIVSKHGLNNIPQEDRALFKYVVDHFDEKFGVYSEKGARDLRRRLRIYKDVEFGNYNYELSLKGNNNNFSQLIKIFNLIITNNSKPEAGELSESLKRYLKRVTQNKDEYDQYSNYILGKGLEVPALTSQPIDDAIVARFFEYNNMFKRSLKDAYVYVGGELPENVDDLISTYIASIEPVRFNTSVNEKASPLFIEKPTVKEIAWGKTSAKSSFMFSNVKDKPVSFKDKLISEGIAEYGYKRMFQILRKKYGFVYSLGASGYANVSQNLSAVSIRYIVEDKTNVDAAQRAMLEEVLPSMSEGILSEHDALVIKALLEKDYVSSFYETDRVSSDYLKWGLDYGELYTMQDFQKIIRTITEEDIEDQMRRLINPDNYIILLQQK
ncbi:M16 family metallopeptidase [Zhouia amylolytica]|nr:insulinase family protein [Zhouia amylolytica]